MTEKEISKHIGKLFFSYRESKGLKPKQVGNLVNLTAKMVRNYEEGTSRVNVLKLLKFAEVLGIPKEKFFDFVNIDDFVADCETRIKKSREVLDIIDEYPELREAIIFYKKHEGEVRELNLPSFLKKYTQISELERDTLTDFVNKLSFRGRLLAKEKKRKTTKK